MLHQFKEHVEANFSFLHGKRLLVACSGGVDSVVLVHLCVNAGLSITLAHCNFKLRGEESEGDEAFVRQLAQHLNIPIRTQAFATQQYASTHRGSLQMAARNLRYRWFAELVHTQDFAYVLTAHHADDTLETFLINLARGTGLKGLLGIPAHRGHVVRPLLPFSRNAVKAYAQAQGLRWREDSSNAQTQYLRNKIRQQLVPQLKALHPTFLNNVLHTQQQLQHTHSVQQQHLAQLQQQLFRDQGHHIAIALKPLVQLRPLQAYLYGLFHPYGFTDWRAIARLLSAPSGKGVYSKTHRLLKHRAHLLLAQRGAPAQPVYSVAEAGTAPQCPVPLRIAPAAAVQKAPPNTLYVAKETLNFPLQLRRWQKGDYFYPFGMQGRKKLSKFFKDEGMSVLAKEQQWLLCAGPDVVWVVGRRADQRFAVTPTTQHILKITLVA